MKTMKFQIAIVAFVFAGLGVIGCTNEDGAGGTSDGTSAEAFELRSEKNLAPAMDTTKASTAVPVTDSSKADSGKIGE